MVIIAMFIANMGEHGDLEKKKHVETSKNGKSICFSIIGDGWEDGLWPVKKGVAHQRKQRLTTNM